MEIGFDPAKRAWTLERRGLDFADAGRVFASPGITVEDDRCDYDEDRYLTYGRPGGRLVAIVWTPRDEVRHVEASGSSPGRTLAGASIR
ncbi:MAG TPA: BrnT family toxin [Allosphingosinicella sp.]|nr:BrnT family toxin [Allosphingosinicella sp.]